VVLQVALQDVVFHRTEDKSNVVCVCGTCEVGVDDFVLVGIETDKHVQDEFFSCLDIPLGTWEMETKGENMEVTVAFSVVTPNLKWHNMSLQARTSDLIKN